MAQTATAGPRPEVDAGRPSRAVLLGRGVLRHAGLIALLAAGAALRVLAMVAVYPGLWFSDSNPYIAAAATGVLSPARVSGYALVVAPFWRIGSAGALIALQHAIGLGIAALIYAFLVHRGARPWLALLAAVPAALDGYLVAIEHMIMAETVFHAALLGAIVLLAWGDDLGRVPAVLAGMVLGYAGVVRSVAVPCIAIFVLYLLLRRVGWRALGLFCVGWLVVIGGYATIFRIQHGTFALSTWQGRFLYARTAPFGDCSTLRGLSASERAICPDPAHRLPTNSYLWGRRSPIRHLPESANGEIGDLGRRFLRQKPLTYARVVAGDVVHYFEPGHRRGANDTHIETWQFPRDPRKYPNYPGYRGPIRPGSVVHTIYPGPLVTRMVSRPHVDVTASRLLNRYQRFYTSGQVLAVCLALVLAALLTRRGAGRTRLDAALIGAAVLTTLVVASALSLFSFRYGFVAVVLLPAAGALAVAALLEPRPEARLPAPANGHRATAAAST